MQLLGERNLPVFHEECYPQDRFWWELPSIVETLRKAEGVEQWKDILQQQFSRDAWKRTKVRHSYSLICLSHLSISDVHAKEPFCHFLVKWTFFCVWLFIYLFMDLAFGNLRPFLCDSFLSLCFNFSPNADDPLWHELQALVNAADVFLFRSNYQRNCSQIQVSCTTKLFLFK